MQLSRTPREARRRSKSALEGRRVGGIVGAAAAVAIDSGSAQRSASGIGDRVDPAMRGRHCAETTHALRNAARSGLSRRTRRYQELRNNLEQFDLQRRLGTIRARLIRVDGALRTAATERNHLAGSQLQNCAARLESLSPLGVLGRGYAVCWNADRTKVIRKASEVSSGDRVRVTLAEGELQCNVEPTSD